MDLSKMMLGWQLHCHPGTGSTTAGPTENAGAKR